MHRYTITYCLALAWATSTLACADDEGDDRNRPISPTSNGASDPGNSGVSSAGDGVDTDDAILGSVDLYVAAGAGVAGLEPGTNVENTVDGWTVSCDRLIVTVGSFDAYPLSGDELALGHPAGLVIDLRQAAAPQRLHGKNVTTREFGDFSFKLPGASAASRLMSPATDADYDLMVKNGYSIYMEGTLTNPAGQSCNPEDPKDCTAAPMLTFKWGLASATEFSGCRGFTVERDQTTDVTLTIPGDHWFRSDFRPDGMLPRRAQWIADADLDRNGETTLEELKMIKASVLFTPELDYDLAGAPIPVDTAHDFLEAQVRTIGLNTATGCSPAGGKECDHWAQDCADGQKCTAYIDDGGDWDATKCVDVTGDGQPGDECMSEGAASGIDTCAKGVMCWGVDDMGVGRCVELCTGSPDAGVCPQVNGVPVICTIANEGVLNLCLPPCDPLLQDCINANEACYPVKDGFTCAPDASGEKGQANDSCAFINVCDKGLTCQDAAAVGAGCEAPATGCCTPFCAFPDGPCPNPDQKCVQYFAEPFPMVPMNSQDIGVCGIAQ